MSKFEIKKGYKLDPPKFFLLITLLISFHLTGCDEKSSQPNDTKSIKIEITAPNEEKSITKSKDINKGINAISGIKIGDPINRIDIVFGIDTLSEKWHQITPEIYHLLTGGKFDDKYYDIHIFKNNENKIKAIACGLMFTDLKLFENGGVTGEAFFSMNRSKCDGEIVKLFSPIVSSQSIFHDKSITQIFGEPLSVKQLEPNPFYINIGVPDKEKVRRLEYQNTIFYNYLDRVHGMAIFDDDIKKLWIEKIEAGLIKK